MTLMSMVRFPLGFGQVFDALAHGNTGVVDQYVELAETGETAVATAFCQSDSLVTSNSHKDALTAEPR